jgi:hypothetical protein
MLLKNDITKTNNDKKSLHADLCLEQEDIVNTAKDVGAFPISLPIAGGKRYVSTSPAFIIPSFTIHTAIRQFETNESQSLELALAIR